MTYQSVPPKRTYTVPVRYVLRGRGAPLRYPVEHEGMDHGLAQALSRMYTALLEKDEELRQERLDSGESIILTHDHLWDLYE